MSDNDELLLEREHTEASCQAAVTVLRGLKEQAGYKLLVREFRIREKRTNEELGWADPDKPGRVGRLQGTSITLREIVSFVDNTIDDLNEKREQLKQGTVSRLAEDTDAEDDLSGPPQVEAAPIPPPRSARRLANAA